MYMVACALPEVRHFLKPAEWIWPSVTVQGPIRYAVGKGAKLYILDEDSHVFEMLILKKALIQPGKP